MSNWGLRLLSGLSLDNSLLGNWVRSGVSHSPATSTTTFPANLTVGGTLTCNAIVASTETISSSETNSGSLTISGILKPGQIYSASAYPTVASSATLGLQVFANGPTAGRTYLMACGGSNNPGFEFVGQNGSNAALSFAAINQTGISTNGSLTCGGGVIATTYFYSSPTIITTTGSYTVAKSCTVINLSSGTVNLSLGTADSGAIVFIRNLTNTATVTITATTIYPYNSPTTVTSIAAGSVNSTAFMSQGFGVWAELYRM